MFYKSVQTKYLYDIKVFTILILTICYYRCRMIYITTIVERVMTLQIKLTDSEITIMNILWESGSLKAGEIAEITLKEKGWKRNTTYTLIQRLIKKDAIMRTDPNFICTAIPKQDEIRIEETKNLLQKMYNGSFKLLVQNFVNKESLSREEIEELRNIIDEVDK